MTKRTSPTFGRDGRSSPTYSSQGRLTRFLASGAQPFAGASDLRGLAAPTLPVPGDDPLHPAEVADLYAASIPGCEVHRSMADVASAIGRARLHHQPHSPPMAAP